MLLWVVAAAAALPAAAAVVMVVMVVAAAVVVVGTRVLVVLAAAVTRVVGLATAVQWQPSRQQLHSVVQHASLTQHNGLLLIET